MEYAQKRGNAGETYQKRDKWRLFTLPFPLPFSPAFFFSSAPCVALALCSEHALCCFARACSLLRVTLRFSVVSNSALEMRGRRYAPALRGRENGELLRSDIMRYKSLGLILKSFIPAICCLRLALMIDSQIHRLYAGKKK